MGRPRARWIYGDAEFRARLAAAGLDELAALSSRSLGELVTDCRSSWVRRWTEDGRTFYVKTYDYPTWRDRIRGLGRNTILAPSRPRREQLALQWLTTHGFAGPRVRAVVESRRFGALCRAVLCTDVWPAEAGGAATDAAALWFTLDNAAQAALRGAVTDLVERLHRAGFRDRNLDLRNILVHRQGERFELAKIDSPRFRIVAPGSVDDRLARADRTRLARSFAQLQTMQHQA